MGSSQKIVSGIVWSTLFNIINAVYNFVAVPILIGYFGKSQYGLIGLAMSINVYMRLMDMGFNSTNVRFFSTWLAEHRHEKVQKAFQTSLSFYGTIGLINGLILFVISFFSDSIFNVTPEQDVILKHLLYILSVVAFCNWFSSCFDQLIKATENVAWIQRRQMIPKALQILVLAATVLIGFNIETYYILTCLATLSILPLSIGKIRRETPFVKFLPKVHWPTFKEMLPYSLNIFSFSLFQFSFYHLRPVFLGMQGTMESVADFRILNGIIGLIHILASSFLPVLLPSTAKVLARQDKTAYYKVAYDGTKYISIVLCFCTFGMMTVGSDALSLYVGEKYLYLIPWFNLWLICNLVTHNQAISSLILAGSDIRAISYSSIVASILGLVTSWFLIPEYQVGGVVIGFAVYGSVQMLFFYLYYWPVKMNISSWRVIYYSFGPYVLLGVIGYFACRLLPQFESHWANFFVQGMAFTIIYMSAWLLMSTKDDREFYLRILKRKK